MDRPHLLNAMNGKMHEELWQIWNDFESDPEIWVGVLSGSGERAFSVGQDLKELVASAEDGGKSTSLGSYGRPGWPRLTERFDFKKPIIASVKGFAFGGGFELALSCDVIIAGQGASFALPEAKLGLIPGAGGLFRLSRSIPSKVAMGYLLTGRIMSASRAYELGLVNEVVPNDEQDSCVERWAEDIIRCSPLAIQAIKQMCLKSASLPLDEAFAAQYEAEERRRTSDDCREGPRAFIGKRKPRWVGL
jgi:crotonobetainyl-CoA hydratase/dehydration protein DpgD